MPGRVDQTTPQPSDRGSQPTGGYVVTSPRNSRYHITRRVRAWDTPLSGKGTPHMHRLGLYRGVAVAFGAACLTFYCVGVSRGDDARHFYIPAVLCAIAAATCLVIHVLKTTVECVVRSEMGKSRATLATSISRAIADEMGDEPAQPRHLMVSR